MENQNLDVVCFGEVLWDNLPSGRKPGGAVMNVSYHLKNLGLNSHLISRVGADQNGNDLLEELNKLKIDVNYCQIDEEHPTSTVEVNISEDNEVRYDIVFPVAWDFIDFDNRFNDLLSNSAALVYGSLSGRNEISRKTLQHLLKLAPYKVMDVNLRPPYVDPAYIADLLKYTDLLKLNLEELVILSDWYGPGCKNESDRVMLLQEKFTIGEVLVTKGSRGASYHSKEIEYHWPAYDIIVKDTVGSGDSFLAAFLSKRLTNTSIKEALNFASGLSAFITTKIGACPPYHRSDINRFMMESELKF